MMMKILILTSSYNIKQADRMNTCSQNQLVFGLNVEKIMCLLNVDVRGINPYLAHSELNIALWNVASLLSLCNRAQIGGSTLKIVRT